MHPITSAKDRDQAQRPSAFKSQPYKQLTCSTLELVHNWNRTNDHKKKSHHTCKHGLMPEPPCWMCSQKLTCSRAELEKSLSQLSSTTGAECSKKVSAQTAASGLTRNDDDRVRPENGQPFQFMPPWQNRHDAHTCSELSLRILLWSASYVKKQSSYTWQEGVLKGPEKQWEAPIAKASVVAIANGAKKTNARNSHCKNRTGKKVDIRLTSKRLTFYWNRQGGSWVSHVPWSEGKVFAGTSGWSVPISSQLMSSFVGSGLMSGPLPPAETCWSENNIPKRLHRFKTTEKVRSFTYLQMVHTHTPHTHKFLIFSHTTCSHTTPSHTHAHNSLALFPLSHATFPLSLTHTHGFVINNPFTHNFVTHNSFTHNFSHTHNFFTRKLFHTKHFHIQLFQANDPPPSPLSFLPSPNRFNRNFGKKLTCGVIRCFSSLGRKVALKPPKQDMNNSRSKLWRLHDDHSWLGMARAGSFEETYHTEHCLVFFLA